MQIKSPSSTWNAWWNMMPPGPPTLHVAGAIDVGNESDGAVLVFDSIEKKNPPNLVLRIDPQTIFVPRDPGDHVVQLHYSEVSSPGTYEDVIIVHNGAKVATITNIRIVH